MYSKIQKPLLKPAGLKVQIKGPPGAEGNLCESSETSVHPTEGPNHPPFP